MGLILTLIILTKMAAHEHVGLLTDEALLHNVAHGCGDCFDLLFLRFFRPVLNLAYRIIRDRTEAEDNQELPVDIGSEWKPCT